MAEQVEFVVSDKNQQKVEDLWSRTFDYSNTIIKKVRKLGFTRFGDIKSPNVEEMLITLQMMSAVFEVLGAHADEADEVRLLLNAKQQILFMERLVSAWKSSDQDEFNKLVGQLENQAQF